MPGKPLHEIPELVEAVEAALSVGLQIPDVHRRAVELLESPGARAIYNQGRADGLNEARAAIENEKREVGEILAVAQASWVRGGLNRVLLALSGEGSSRV